MGLVSFSGFLLGLFTNTLHAHTKRRAIKPKNRAEKAKRAAHITFIKKFGDLKPGNYF